METYVLIDGKPNGPHSIEALRALCDAGKICGEQWAWRDGMDEWKTLKELVPECLQDSEQRATIDEEAPGPADEVAPLSQQDAGEEAVETDQKPENPPPDKLYLGVAGEKLGPFSPDETVALLLSGEVRGEDLAWKSGMTEWQPLMKVWPDCENLASIPETKAQPPSGGLSEKLRKAFRKD